MVSGGVPCVRRCPVVYREIDKEMVSEIDSEIDSSIIGTTVSRRSQVVSIKYYIVSSK